MTTFYKKYNIYNIIIFICYPVKKNEWILKSSSSDQKKFSGLVIWSNFGKSVGIKTSRKIQWCYRRKIANILVDIDHWNFKWKEVKDERNEVKRRKKNSLEKQNKWEEWGSKHSRRFWNYFFSKICVKNMFLSRKDKKIYYS